MTPGAQGGERPWKRREVIVHLGDCREVMTQMAEASFDSMVTDAPYEIGFMGRKWDRTGVAFDPATWAAALRVLKPGAHLAAFSGTRTYHRMACAIEDAGFEIRDQLAWVYGSGMPKSAGLKPAWEPICLARKPCEGSRKANIAAHGTGGLNIDACRVGESGARNNGRKVDSDIYGKMGAIERVDYGVGRWPANILHDGSDEVLARFPETASGALNRANITAPNRIFGTPPKAIVGEYAPDSGSAARFFYSAKAGPLDRLGSEHPTVKPVDLMRWLCRLITPPGGLILDPFAGSGTTAIAAIAEGFHAELIDLEPNHIADIEAKLAYLRGDGGRIVERHLKRKADRAAEPLALFGVA